MKVRVKEDTVVRLLRKGTVLDVAVENPETWPGVSVVDPLDPDRYLALAYGEYEVVEG